MKKTNLAIICLLSISNVSLAAIGEFAELGKVTSSSEDSFTFYKTEDSTFGKYGFISIKDKSGFDSVGALLKEDALKQVYGYIRQQAYYVNPASTIDAAVINVGKNACINNPASCGITTSSGFSQENIDSAVAEAKQGCVNDPVSCGVTTSSSGFSQEDIDSAVAEAKQGCVNDPVSCGITTETTYPSVNLSPSLSFHLGKLTLGQQQIWANFKLVPDSSKILFEVETYGESLGNDQDGDGYTIEQGDCNDIDPNINPSSEEITGDSIDQNCQNSSDD